MFSLAVSSSVGLRCVCESVSHSVVSNSVIPWTVAHQAPLSTGLSSQEYWSGLPFPSPQLALPYLNNNKTYTLKQRSYYSDTKTRQRHHKKRKNYTIYHMNMDAKIFKKILANNPGIYIKMLHHDQWDLSQESKDDQTLKNQPIHPYW